MPFIAVYDADVLYPNTLRDLLIRIAQLPHLVQAKWTEKILDEVTDNLRKNMPDITAEKTNRLRQLMNTAVGDCLVSGCYRPIIWPRVDDQRQRPRRPKRASSKVCGSACPGTGGGAAIAPALR